MQVISDGRFSSEASTESSIFSMILFPMGFKIFEGRDYVFMLFYTYQSSFYSSLLAVGACWMWRSTLTFHYFYISYHFYWDFRGNIEGLIFYAHCCCICFSPWTSLLFRIRKPWKVLMVLLSFFYVTVDFFGASKPVLNEVANNDNSNIYISFFRVDISLSHPSPHFHRPPNNKIIALLGSSTEVFCSQDPRHDMCKISWLSQLEIKKFYCFI